jgi:hypothetical protein
LPKITSFSRAGLSLNPSELGVFDFDIRFTPPTSSRCTVNGSQDDIFSATFVLGAGEYKYPNYDFSQNKHFTFIQKTSPTEILLYLDPQDQMKIWTYFTKLNQNKSMFSQTLVMKGSVYFTAKCD